MVHCVVTSQEVVNTVILYSERKMVNRSCSYHTQVVYCGNLHVFDTVDQAAGRSSGLSNQPAVNILIYRYFLLLGPGQIWSNFEKYDLLNTLTLVVVVRPTVVKVNNCPYIGEWLERS